jgi:hypothetical protein
LNNLLEALDKRFEQQNQILLKHISGTSSDNDPWEHTSALTTNEVLRELRDNMKRFYGTRVECFVSGVHDDPSLEMRQRVLAAHTWPRFKSPPFNVSLRSIDDAANGMFLLHDIEKAFDLRRVCFLCCPFQRTMQFYVLDPSLHAVSPTRCNETFAELHSTIISVDPQRRPSFRLLSLHCLRAALHAVKQGWISPEEANQLETFYQVSSPDRMESDNHEGGGVQGECTDQDDGNDGDVWQPPVPNPSTLCKLPKRVRQ